MEKNKYISYNMDYIKAIPITDILRDYGIQVNKNFCKVRDERTPSCQIYPNTNTWFDHGITRGGSTIDIVMFLDNCDFKTAVRTLGSRYDAPTLNNAKPDPNIKTLSETQYNSIGLFGSPAYYNILLPKYADQFTGQMVQTMQEKYSMPMNQLFEKEPNTYIAILNSESMPFMKSCYNNYLNSLRIMAADAKEYGVTSIEYRLSKTSSDEISKGYEDAYKALARAVQGTDIEIKKLKPDYEKDLARINKVSIEIGDFSYTELRQLPGEMRHIDVGIEAYNTFHHAVTYEELQLDANYSAHVKGDTVTLSCKAQDENTFKGIFQSIEVQQQYQQQQKAPALSSGLDL